MINFKPVRYAHLIFVDFEFISIFLTNVASLYKNFIHKEGTIIFASFGQCFPSRRNSQLTLTEKENETFSRMKRTRTCLIKIRSNSETHLRNARMQLQRPQQHTHAF